MPLKIRIKPEGKFFAGGTVIKNAGKYPADLLILSDTPVLRDDYLVNMESEDKTDIANVYFLLQIVYLYKGKGKPRDQLVLETLNSFKALYPDLKGIVDQIQTLLETGESFKALRLAHALLEKDKKENAS